MTFLYKSVTFFLIFAIKQYKKRPGHMTGSSADNAAATNVICIVYLPVNPIVHVSVQLLPALYTGLFSLKHEHLQKSLRPARAFSHSAL